MTKAPSSYARSRKGFRQTGTLVETMIRRTGEARGFAVSRLLTHWPEIVGEDVARIARPVNVSYGRGGFGATLTVLTRGAHAPQLDMQKERIRQRVNSCYGYAAIARIRITQTAPTGFAEGAAQFGPAPKAPAPPPDPEAVQKARDATAPIADDGLREALNRLGVNALGTHHTG